MKAELVNEDKIYAALRRFEGNVWQKLRQFSEREGAQMETEIKASMKIGGRIKGKGPRGGKLRAHSKEGEAPYVQTGRLRASIGYILQYAKRFLFLDIGAIRKGRGEVTYARKLEEELKRPYLLPVVKRHLDKWAKLLKVQIQRIKP